MGWNHDPDAIHSHQSGEIQALTEKTTPVDADVVVIEDSEDSWAKKKVALSEIGTGGGGGSYSETIGDNSNTSFQVTHSLGTQDLVVQLWDLTGSDPVEATGDADSITVDDEDNITVAFSAPPATDSYRVVVLSDGGTSSGGGGGGGGGLASGWQGGNAIAAAVGIPIVTSSNKQPGRVGYLIDGAITEEQYASGSSQQIGDYIEFDFGVAIELEGLRMVGLYGSNIGTDYPRGWEVLSSDTGAFSGEEIQRGTGSATGWGGGTLDTTFTAASARYWRIRLTSAAGNHWRINEVFFGIP